MANQFRDFTGMHTHNFTVLPDLKPNQLLDILFKLTYYQTSTGMLTFSLIPLLCFFMTVIQK